MDKSSMSCCVHSAPPQQLKTCEDNSAKKDFQARMCSGLKTKISHA